MRVVIVDDHPVVRAGMRAVLESALAVEVVEDFCRPEDAIAWIRAHEVDLILMDLRFGLAGQEEPMGGVEAVRAIRALDGPPVLVVTSYGSEPEILDALAAGAAGYVLKDAHLEELLTAIDAAAQGERFLGTGVRSRVEQRKGGADAALTERELEVLRHVAAGSRNAEIALALSLSEATIKTHLNRVFAKLQVSSRTAAVAEARGLGALEA